MNQPDKNDNKYDRLWKLRTLFDQLSDTYVILGHKLYMDSFFF